MDGGLPSDAQLAASEMLNPVVPPPEVVTALCFQSTSKGAALLCPALRLASLSDREETPKCSSCFYLNSTQPIHPHPTQSISNQLKANSTHPNPIHLQPTQPTQPNPTHPHSTQPTQLTQPNPANSIHPQPTQPNQLIPTQPNPTQPNPIHPHPDPHIATQLN